MKNISRQWKGTDNANPNWGSNSCEDRFKWDIQFGPLFFHVYCFHPNFWFIPSFSEMGPQFPPSFLAIENLQNHFILQIINFTSLQNFAD